MSFSWNWYDIKYVIPVDGLKIFAYSTDMDADAWIAAGIFPVLIWDDTQKGGRDCDGTILTVTHWLPFPDLPKDHHAS